MRQNKLITTASNRQLLKIGAFLTLCFTGAALTGCFTTYSEKAQAEQQSHIIEVEAGEQSELQGEIESFTDSKAQPRKRVLVTASKPGYAMALAAPLMEASLSYDGSYAANSENYASLEENSVKVVAEEPVSTFSIDVDTASYTNVRSMLNGGIVPPVDAVRTEEFINYFDYGYELPDETSPFSMHTDVVVSPWNKQRHLMRVALKGFEPDFSDIPGANLVFLIDVSGSMNNPKKLPLLKQSLKMLSKQLSQKDRVAIVVYAGASGVVLEPTAGDDYHAIAQALRLLSAGGSTNGASGIELAYAIAQKSFIKDGINRVILATDGDFNVGQTDHDELIDLIERKRESGISLSVLGFGRGNYNDHLTEQLADAGNGNAAYIDNINEARKVLVDEMHSTLHTIAKDVKIQVEFNPNTVAEYRLIGYENRQLKREDFNNDKVDAGEIGAGHTVTAFYEVALKGSGGEWVDGLRYQKDNEPLHNISSSPEELAFLKIRYKEPDEKTSKLLSKAILKQDIMKFAEADSDFKFATSVVGFAGFLSHSDFTQNVGQGWLVDNAVQNKGIDTFGYRAEFTQLMRNYFAMDQLSATKPQNKGFSEKRHAETGTTADVGSSGTGD